MHGNGWEWCQDWRHEDYQDAPTDGGAWEEDGGIHRVIRGGLWRLAAWDCRSAIRSRSYPWDRYEYIGFRVASSLIEPSTTTETPTSTPTPMLSPTPTPTDTLTPSPTVTGTPPTPTVTPVGYVSVPTGLEATGGASAVLLSWNPNPEPHLAGYNVYRDTRADGTFTGKLNTDLLPQPSYIDETASAGVLYHYKVAAVSLQGSESAKSESASASIGTIEVWMPDVRGPAGAEVVLPINVTYATGITGNGMDIKVTYDATLLTPVEVQKTVLTQEFTFLDNSSIANGQINISGISAQGATIVGEGHILDIVFDVADTATLDATGSFVFVEVKMYDATPSLLSVDYSDTAILTVSPQYILGDIDGNGVVDSADALIALQISTGERIPTDLEQQAGDVNGDGVIDSADVTLILRLSVGLPLNPTGSKISLLTREQKSLVAATQYALTIGNGWGERGESVSIPITISSMEGIAGIDLVVNFDASILSLQTVTEGTLIQSGFVLDYEVSGGSIRISLAGPQAPVSQGGTILELNFQVLGLPPDTSALLPAYLKLSGEYGENKVWKNTVEATAGSFQTTGTSGIGNSSWSLYE